MKEKLENFENQAERNEGAGEKIEVIEDVFYTTSNDESEKVTMTKQEYDDLKHSQEYLYKIMLNDFFIKINSGSILPLTHPNYYNNRIDIEIVNSEIYSITIEKEKYKINSEVLEKIKELINVNIEKLIKYSLSQNKSFMLEHSFAGGIGSTITIKYGKLLISVNGNVEGEMKEFCEKFINEIKLLIIQ